MWIISNGGKPPLFRFFGGEPWGLVVVLLGGKSAKMRHKVPRKGLDYPDFLKIVAHCAVFGCFWVRGGAFWGVGAPGLVGD